MAAEVKKYSAKPGYTLIGFDEFPIETNDVDIQGQIEATEAFKIGKIWITDTSNDEEIEGALKNIKFTTMRKMASMAGYRDVHKLTKVELLEILEKEGF